MNPVQKVQSTWPLPSCLAWYVRNANGKKRQLHNIFSFLYITNEENNVEHSEYKQEITLLVSISTYG